MGQIKKFVGLTVVQRGLAVVSFRLGEVFTTVVRHVFLRPLKPEKEADGKPVMFAVEGEKRPPPDHSLPGRSKFAQGNVQ